MSSAVILEVSAAYLHASLLLCFHPASSVVLSTIEMAECECALEHVGRIDRPFPLLQHRTCLLYLFTFLLSH